MTATPAKSESSKSEQGATVRSDKSHDYETRILPADPIAERRAVRARDAAKAHDDDRKPGTPSDVLAKALKDLKGSSLVALVVEDGKVYLDGKEVDFSDDKPSKKDGEFLETIKQYSLSDGEFYYDSVDHVISPAGVRAGSGDTGMMPKDVNSRRTVHPNANRPKFGREDMEDNEDDAGKYALAPEDTTEKMK